MTEQKVIKLDNSYIFIFACVTLINSKDRGSKKENNSEELKIW